MNNKFKVIQIGLGPMGRIITNLLLKRRNIDLIGVVEIDPELIGKKLNRILEIEHENNIVIESSLDLILSNKKADIVIIATSSFIEKVSPIIINVVKFGCHVISICEELSYPFKDFPKISQELDALAKSNNVTIIGTGINPGYLMDLLPIVISAPCQSIMSIKVTRLMNSAKRRQSFQEKIGTGLSVEEFHKKIRNKKITGHVGLTQSIQMILTALGLDYDEVLELPPKEIITEKNFMTSYGKLIPQGYVCGLKSKAIAKKENQKIIVLDFIAYAGEHEEYDSIKINGIPNINQKIVGGVHGDLGTSAIVVNLIPKVIDARPGLLTMKDISVPCNTENIWKK
jgi:4-hydroxy-tetrahydrodipicolinate reductase